MLSSKGEGSRGLTKVEDGGLECLGRQMLGLFLGREIFG
jgi:hypothetical protein